MNRIVSSMFLALVWSSAFGDTQALFASSAVLDKDIPENDENPEKLIPNEFLCGNGGCPWVVYSPQLNKVIGRIFGNAIVILDTTTEGYKTIQTSWNLGADKTGIAVFKFRNGVYERDK